MPTYYIHDNGGRPFVVKYNGSQIDVYKFDHEPLIKIFTIKKFKKLFAGGPNDKGNSVLIHLDNTRYIFIGWRIEIFDTKGDEIVRYISNVGNSDVPYPYAITRDKKYYMMVEDYYITGDIHKSTDKDPYSVYYNHQNQQDTIKIKKYKFTRRLLVDRGCIRVYKAKLKTLGFIVY